MMNDYNQNSHYQNFQAACEVLHNVFDPGVDQSYWEIVNVICTTLMDDKNLPIYSHHHPFHKYGDYPIASQNIQALRLDVEAKATSRAERHAVQSFFAPGGVHYDMLEELMIAYWSFVDNILGNNANDADDELENNVNSQ